MSFIKWDMEHLFFTEQTTNFSFPNPIEPTLWFKFIFFYIIFIAKDFFIEKKIV